MCESFVQCHEFVAAAIPAGRKDNDSLSITEPTGPATGESHLQQHSRFDPIDINGYEGWDIDTHSRPAEVPEEARCRLSF